MAYSKDLQIFATIIPFLPITPTMKQSLPPQNSRYLSLMSLLVLFLPLPVIFLHCIPSLSCTLYHMLSLYQMSILMSFPKISTFVFILIEIWYMTFLEAMGLGFCPPEMSTLCCFLKPSLNDGDSSASRSVSLTYHLEPA